ncbi:MAG: serine/threonine-protein phosphatase, partial [Patescibacteria group bacterium]
AKDAKGEQYGMNRLKRIVQDAADDFYSADAIKNAVLSDVKQFMGTSEQLDDITIMVLKRKAV